MIILYILSGLNFLFCLSLTRFSPFGFQLHTSWSVLPFITLFVIVLAIINMNVAKTKKIKESQLRVFWGSCLSYIVLVILALSIVIMSSPLHKTASYEDGKDMIFMFWSGGPFHSGALVTEHQFMGIFKIIHYWDEDDQEFEYYYKKAKELGLYPYE